MSAPNILGTPEQAQKKPFPWPLAIGAAIVLVAIGLVILLTQKPAEPGAAAPPPYAASLKLSDIKMATANNFVGGTVTYLEGNIQNAGNQAVTGVQVELIFQNSMNQVVQKERLPVMVTTERPGYSDTVDLSRAPLAPSQTRPFRLTLEHVSDDWNQAYPDVRIVDVKTK